MSDAVKRCAPQGIPQCDRQEQPFYRLMPEVTLVTQNPAERTVGEKDDRSLRMRTPVRRITAELTGALSEGVATVIQSLESGV